MPVDIAPLSYGQEGLRAVHETRGATSVYHDRSVYLVTGPLDVAAFRSAVHTLVARHPVLRRRIVGTETRSGLVTDDPWPGEVTLREADAGLSREAAIESFLHDRTRLTFNLATGPLLRVDLLRFTADDHVVAWTMHRTVADCWSLGVMLDQVAHIYADLRAGRLVRPAPPAPDYDEFVAWQRSEAQEAEIARLLEHWSAQIGDAPRQLPFRPSARPAAGTPESADTIEFALSAQEAENLRLFSKSSGGTLYMGLLTTFQLAVAHALNIRDMLVGVPVAGRSMIEFEECIGYFVNVLALRADLRDDPTAADLIRRTRQAVLSGIAHQDLPFERLVAHVNPPGTPPQSPHPLVQATMQVIEEGSESELRLTDCDVRSMYMPEYQIAHALTLNLYTSASGVHARLLHNPNYAGPGIAHAVATTFARLVATMPERPEAHVSELLASPAAPHRVR